MRTIRKLLPGKPGTKKLFKQYGNDLVCVRYRYDSAQGLKVKTIELVVERSLKQCKVQEPPGETIMHLRIEYGEVDLGRQVKAAGGKWNARKRVWELPYKDAVALGLTDRIVPDANG
jgi:hypothetical protein